MPQRQWKVSIQFVQIWQANVDGTQQYLFYSFFQSRGFNHGDTFIDLGT